VFWESRINTVSSPIALGGSLALTGTQFRGISGASSGGTADASSDFPLVQLRNLESGQTAFLPPANWSATSFTSAPVTGFPPGLAMVTVFANGIPGSFSVFVDIGVTPPTPPILTDARMTNRSFTFNFTNSVGALFRALATTNLSTPSSNWTVLGGVAEVSPGRFQFTDAGASNRVQRFYRARSE
jgi:hypothetical protein